MENTQSKGFDILDELRESFRTVDFNTTKHDRESRLNITKLFLKWYFCLIAGSYIFALIYNMWAAHINLQLINAGQVAITYLDVSNTVSIITTTLSSGVGFVIGYYFKNKDDKG